MLTYTTLASGSSGNCGVASCGDTHLLVDAGISARRITAALKSLGIAPAALSGVLITHEHSDHISGLATLAKQLGLRVYATAPTLDRMHTKLPILEKLGRPFQPGEAFSLGTMWVESFPTPHDAACSVGYALTGDGCRAAVATDLGCLTQAVLQAVRGCDLLVCEANHDVDWVRSGPYPYYLQERILGSRGHLSNETGAELAASAVEAGARTVILAHLSSENNTPARAYAAAAARLTGSGIDPKRDLSLTVAPRAECGPVFRLERGRDPVQFRLREGGCLMLSVFLVCVGKLKERFYQDAAAEYQKRLSAYCRLTLIEVPEEKLPQNPTQGQIDQALKKEALAIRAKLPSNVSSVALCVEGRERSSEDFANLLATWEHSFAKHLAFIIGGSYGLDPALKAEAWVQLSMSPMTFPHHLARIMLLEQLYRAFKIREGSSYHK